MKEAPRIHESLQGMVRLRFFKPKEWGDVKDIIHQLNLGSFGEDMGIDQPVLGDKVKGKDTIAYQSWKEAFQDPGSVTVLIKDLRDGTIVGYAIAVPRSKFNPTIKDPSQAYLYATVVADGYRGKRLAPELTNNLLIGLLEKGYKFVSRDTVEDYGYAEKVYKASKGAIRRTYTHNKYDLGTQRYIKIDIRKYLQMYHLL